jgi:hypothetical protein
MRCRHPRSYVDKAEKLTRFVYELSFINKRVSQNVFRVGHDNTLSVYRTNDCRAEHIWNICSQFVDGLRADNKKACGRVELNAKAFMELKFAFDPNGKPHTRHTDVLGWHANKPDDLDRRNALALASKAFLKPE